MLIVLLWRGWGWGRAGDWELELEGDQDIVGLLHVGVLGLVIVGVFVNC